jgi:hypothetical protein
MERRYAMLKVEVFFTIELDDVGVSFKQEMDTIIKEARIGIPEHIVLLVCIIMRLAKKIPPANPYNQGNPKRSR